MNRMITMISTFFLCLTVALSAQGTAETVPVDPIDKRDTFKAIPTGYENSMKNGGVIERVDYTVPIDGKPVDTHAYVYLPEDYTRDRDRQYDILYLMHGGGGRAETFFSGTGRSTALKNLLDHMIAAGELNPLIVVTPTYYTPGSSDDATLVREFQAELIEYLMPAVEGTYHTYAPSPDRAGFEASRAHRAFGGFSMGAVTTWYTFIHNLDYFSYFLPMSGDSWSVEMMGGLSRTTETVDALQETAGSSKYGAAGFFIYAVTGTNDIAYENMTAQLEEMAERNETFSFGTDPEKDNLYYMAVDGAYHTYSAMNDYLYHTLPYVFQTKE